MGHWLDHAVTLHVGFRRVAVGFLSTAALGAGQRVCAECISDRVGSLSNISSPAGKYPFILEESAAVFAVLQIYLATVDAATGKVGRLFRLPFAGSNWRSATIESRKLCATKVCVDGLNDGRVNGCIGLPYDDEICPRASTCILVLHEDIG
jgi:hypothetical protein